MLTDLRNKLTSESKGSNPWLVLGSVSLGLFMVVVDISILNIALPTIAADMKADLSEVEWTLIAYTLALTGLVPIFGRISDVIGRKRLFLTGIIIFALGSLVAASSVNLGMLIGARLIQALGGGLITSNTLAIITDTFPAGKRGAAMGIQAILVSGGAALGPTLGGFLVTNLGWQAVFLVNVPVGVVAATTAFFVIPPLKSNRTLEPIDWVGAGLIMGGFSSLLLGITKGPDWGWTNTSILLPLGVGIALSVTFIWWELRRKFPLVDLSLFKIREFAAGQTAGIFATIALSSMMLIMPFYWQGLRGFSAEKAGVLMLPMPLSLMVVAPLAGRYSDKLGARGLATTGLVIIMVGLFLISRVGAEMQVWDVLWRLSVFGAGLGMFMAPNNNAVMSSVPAARRGIASGLLGTFRYTGQSLGVALAGTVFASFVTGHGGLSGAMPSPETMHRLAADPAALAAFQHSFMRGMHAAALSGIPFAGVGAILSLLRGSVGQQSETGQERVTQASGRPSMGNSPQSAHQEH